jgi:hypothetical protein
MRQILKDAYKSEELHHQLTEVISYDDQCAPEDMIDSLIINEAHHVLSKYTGGIGFVQEEEYNGEHGIDAQQEARQNVRALKAFIKKYN